MSCHGTAGESVSGDIPNLAGQKREYLVNQLSAFRAGERKNELMQAVAQQLSPEDINALAAYWSALPAAAAKEAPASISSQMTFPASFPSGLIEYDREIDLPTQVVFVRYANAVAVEAARAGSSLPPGSMLFTGEYAAALDAANKPRQDAEGRWTVARLLSVSGMQTEQGWGSQVPPLLRNADWNYGLWSPAGQPRLGTDHARCLACHKPLAAQDYVFTISTLRAAKATAGASLRR
jgi:hypothetical protein